MRRTRTRILAATAAVAAALSGLVLTGPAQAAPWNTPYPSVNPADYPYELEYKWFSALCISPENVEQARQNGWLSKGESWYYKLANTQVNTDGDLYCQGEPAGREMYWIYTKREINGVKCRTVNQTIELTYKEPGILGQTKPLGSVTVYMPFCFNGKKVIRTGDATVSPTTVAPGFNSQLVGNIEYTTDKGDQTEIDKKGSSAGTRVEAQVDWVKPAGGLSGIEVYGNATVPTGAGGGGGVALNWQNTETRIQGNIGFNVDPYGCYSYPGSGSGKICLD